MIARHSDSVYLVVVMLAVLCSVVAGQWLSSSSPFLCVAAQETALVIVACATPDSIVSCHLELPVERCSIWYEIHDIAIHSMVES